MLRRVALSLLALVALAGCDAATTPVAQSSSQPTATAATTPAPTPARPTPRASITPPAPRPTPPTQASRGGQGRVVVLDAGHNGGNAAHPEVINRQVPAGFGQTKACNTTGTATAAGYPEHAFTWDVTLRVRDLLRARGLTVLLTRDNDTGVGPCVNRRGTFGNALHADAVVSIHGDGNPTGHGFHVIEAARAPAGAAIAAASHQLATAVHDEYLAGSGIAPATYIGQGGYDHRSDLAGLNLSLRPTAMIECGNMRNASDAARMSSPAGRLRIAAAIAAGILAFLG